MKASVVGLGGMGSTHYNMLRVMDDIEIIALVDVEESRVLDKASDCGARAYTDLNKMLDNENPDFLIVCTPSYLHCEHAVAAMQKGIHTLVEKPTALNEEDVKKMWKCAVDNNVMFMTALVIRFWDEYVWLKNAVDNNTYGKLLHLNMWRVGERPTYSQNNWMLDEEKSGLVPFDLHIHDVDFIVYLLGTPEKTDFFQINGSPGQYVESIFGYKDGPRVHAKAAWLLSKIPFRSGYEAIFEDGYADFNNDKLSFYANNGEVTFPVSKANFEGSEINVSNTSGYTAEIKYFTDCIRTGTFPSIIKEDELLTAISLIKQYKGLS